MVNDIKNFLAIRSPSSPSSPPVAYNSDEDSDGLFHIYLTVIFYIYRKFQIN